MAKKVWQSPKVKVLEVSLTLADSGAPGGGEFPPIIPPTIPMS